MVKFDINEYHVSILIPQISQILRNLSVLF